LSTKTNTATGAGAECAGPVTEADLARLIAELDEPGTSNHTRPYPVASSVIQIYEMWPQLVRLGRYSDLHSLAAIVLWFRDLHTRDQLQPGVSLTLEPDPGHPSGLRGVLFDPNASPLYRWTVLRRGHYLVQHGNKKLEVVDELTVHTRYRRRAQDSAPNPVSIPLPNMPPPRTNGEVS